METFTMNDFLTQLNEMMKINPGLSQSVDAIIGGMDNIDAATRFMKLSQSQIDSLNEGEENVEANINNTFIKKFSDDLLSAISEYEDYEMKLTEISEESNVDDEATDLKIEIEVFPESKAEEVNCEVDLSSSTIKDDDSSIKNF